MDSIAPSRIAIYARYSSDLQNPSSVDDQVALCRGLIADKLRVAPQSVMVFSDSAISGTTMDRPGFIELQSAVTAGRIDVVVSEGLDRLSRSLKDIASIHEIFLYHKVEIITVHEGRITELHIGLKGTMNALVLRDMKARIRRGHRARIAAGFAIAACPFGYKVVRGVTDDKGRNVNGVRKIDEAAAAVVRRIYQEYIDGRSLMGIVEGLNRDGVPAPNGGRWKSGSLMAGATAQQGILHNEAYLGKLIFNRTNLVRDPITGKRHIIKIPESEWIRVEVPHLRIISDEMWVAVRESEQARQQKRQEYKKPKPRILNSHNQHPLTGWVKCGWCGELKSIANNSRYLCSGHRYNKTCRNARAIKEPVLLAATFEALYARIKGGPALRPQFVTALASEMERSKKLNKCEGEIKARIDRLLDAIEHGVNVENATKRILELQKDLQHVRQDIRKDALPALPNEATIRATLARAVQSIEMSRDIKHTRLMFQHLLSEIVLTPIPDRYHGETIKLTLREEGWPDFWRMAVGELGMAPPRQK